LEGFLGMCDDDDGGGGGIANAAIIDQCSLAVRDILKRAIRKAHDKLRAFYGRTWAGMYAIAVILDPTLKMDYYIGNGWEPEDVARARNALHRVIEEYEAAESHEAASPQPDVAQRINVDERIYRRVKRQRIQKGTEMEQYLAAPTIDCGEGILEWWRAN